uniref:Kelch-like ECH-associated protein 1 n=1 Tax=Schistocephalus solidus TaxID=70667 RepID=A0A0X3Q0A8_SCHSO
MKNTVEDFPMADSASSTGTTASTVSTDSETQFCQPVVNAGGINFVCIGGNSSPSGCGTGDRNGSPSSLGVNYNVSEYASEAMSVMFSLFQSGKLTDVTLRVENVKIPCHRIVLTGASPYFRAMFTSGMKEEAVPEISLHYITPLALHRLVHFAYTGQIRVNELNVCEILSAATMLQMSPVVNVCSSFLESQLHVSNALGIQDFANSVGCLSLARKTQAFIDRNFSEIVKHDELVNLSATQFISLIQRDEIHVRTEAEVYNAVIRWVNHDKPSRLVNLLDTLALVRCYALPPAFIRSQIKNCSLLADVPESKQYMEKVLKDLLEHKNIPTKWRADAHAQMVYSAGGYLRYSLSTFEAYCHSTGAWHRLPDLPSPRSGLAACSVRGCVYLVGGRNNNEQGNVDAPHMDSYDPATNSWRTCAPMSVPRNRVAVGVIDDMIYAVGGSTSTTHHKTAEKYDVDLDLWTPIAPMHYPRVGLGVAVVNRLLYAVGGFDGDRRLASVERYNPETDVWVEVASLNRPRSGAGVVGLGHHIYAVGGYDSYSQLRSVERYDSECNVWEYMAHMIHPRSALSASVLNGKIWVFGGYDGNEFLSSVEIYDPSRNIWVERTFMPFGKSGHAVVTSREPMLSV